MSKLAKRGGPPDVPSAIHNNIEYAVIHYGEELGESQNGGFVVATDMASEKRLWVLKVYETTYNPKKEMDVQDIFIEKLAITNGKLRVVDRLARQFMIDLDTKRIMQTRPNPQQKMV